jgi:AcrR family transcriptional regulator
MARPREFDPSEALDQAMRAFWRQGFASTSFEDLIKASKVNKQSLYCAFGDKRALFLKALGLYRHQVLTQIRTLLDQGGSPIEGVKRVMHFATLPAVEKSCPPGCLLANTALELGDKDRDAAREAKALFDGMEKLLSEAIKKGQKQGEITTRFSSSVLAQNLVNALNGIRILEKTGASHKQIRALSDLAVEMLKI